MKWKNDLAMYMDSFATFVLEGSINDLQPSALSDGSRYEYLSLSKAIARQYSDKYCVVFYDHTRKSGEMIRQENTAENDDDDDENHDAPANTNADSSWFNSFIFYNDSDYPVNSDNVEFFKRYYYEEYMRAVSGITKNDLQGGQIMDVRRICNVMEDYGTRKEEFPNIKPFLFIIPDLSRFMTTPGRPVERENNSLMVLFNATQVEDTECRLVLMLDKMNDLPTWFESENTNSALKKIYVSLPNADMRETFYKEELSRVMFPIPSDLEREKVIKKYKKFSSYTENYSFRRLHQLMDFIVNESTAHPEFQDVLKNIDSIDKTVFKFEVGQNFDPWKNPELRAIVRELPANLKEELQGQNEAIASVSKSIRAAVAGVNSSKADDRRPKAIMMFAGPTGTGKTEMAKQIAENIFKNQDSMIRFDMSEFREEHTDARLFGAPPGYVGYEAGGELTRAIKEKPFAIVLFDEIEKANPKIWDKFLQILGDGRLTDGKGETVSFSQSIIIFTTNLGITPDGKVTSTMRLEDIQAVIDHYLEQMNVADARSEALNKLVENVELKMRYIGLRSNQLNEPLFQTYYADLTKYFDDPLIDSPVSAFNNFVAMIIRKRIAEWFESIGRREVMGRIGETNVVPFNFVSQVVARKIAEKTINKAVKNLRNENDSHMELIVTPEAKEYLLERSCSLEKLNLGARGIINEIDSMMSEPLGLFLFENEGTNIRGELRVENVGSDKILSVTKL